MMHFREQYTLCVSDGRVARVQSTLRALRVLEHANQREKVIWVHCPRNPEPADGKIAATWCRTGCARPKTWTVLYSNC